MHEVGVVQHAQTDVVLDVGARGERPAVAVQDGAWGRRRAGEPRYVLIEQSERMRAQRIEFGRLVQRDERYAVRFPVLDIVGGLQASPPIRLRTGVGDERRRKAGKPGAAEDVALVARLQLLR